MKTPLSVLTIALALSWGICRNVQAQSSVGIGAQITAESSLIDGAKYILQSQAAGSPYIVDAGTYYSVPNAVNSPSTASVYYFYKNEDGTWKIKNQHTGKYWGVPVGKTELAPAIELEAGAWSLNFAGGIAYPTAPDADGTVYHIDRSSQKIVAWTEQSSVAQRVKIYEVDAPLSSEPLSELADKTIAVAEEPTAELAVGRWYVMFDRGFTDGIYPHGYLYEDETSHTLYNSADAPSGTALSMAKYLVRLSDAGEGRYYIQNGFGNYFGAFTQGTAVPVVGNPAEAIIIDKIASTDGHFYLQSVTTNTILDANDVRNGKATVVGWGTSVPSAIGGNNDWAFYEVELEDIGEEVALFLSDINVVQGYQTTGRGNSNALLLRIDIVPTKPLQTATFNISLDETTCANISGLSIYETRSTEFIANLPEAPLAQTEEIAGQVAITLTDVPAGTHHLWLCCTVRDDAALGAILDAALTSISYFSTAEAELDVTAIGNPSRQGLKVFESQNFVFCPTTDDCRYYRIPAMILDAEGNIVVASDKRYNSNSDLGNHKIDVVSKRSEDGGRTWQDLAEVAVGDGRTAAYYGYGDAAFARAENGNLVCIMAAGNKMWGSNATDGMMYAGYALSADNGKSWSLTRNLFASDLFTDENNADGSLSVANIFTSSGKGLTTTDGVIMFTTNCRKPGTSSPNLCYILYSTDNGSSWRLSNALAYSGCDESKLEQLNDGSLLLSVRQSGNRGWNTGTYVKNGDGSVTFEWGTQYRSADLWGNACNADMVYYSRQSATEPDIMLHSYINSSGRESLQIAMSLDGGKTWNSVYNIQPNGSCYSTMVVLPDGTLALLYEDESYSAGNGYAINFVTITREQIVEWFEALGGQLPDGVEQLIRQPEATSKYGIYDVSGQRIGALHRGINVAQGKKLLVR
ncbi:MAG: exo-alpha-sialidase [Bacteroidaceae bacterium]|nr:exo-alpha-sialidase [Bacteroidaceae bacterium]